MPVELHEEVRTCPVFLMPSLSGREWYVVAGFQPNIVAAFRHYEEAEDYGERYVNQMGKSVYLKPGYRYEFISNPTASTFLAWVREVPPWERKKHESLNAAPSGSE